MIQASQTQRGTGRIAGWVIVMGMLSAAMPALAEPITWTLTDIGAQGGQPVTGYFVFDADTIKVTDFNIDFAANFFVGFDIAYNPGDAFVARVNSDINGFGLYLDQPGASHLAPPLAADFYIGTSAQLTDAGGRAPVIGGAEYTNDQAEDSAAILNGWLVGTSAPEPSSLAIGGLGLGLLALKRRLSVS